MEKWKKNTNSGQFSRGATDTKQNGTGTISVMSFYFGLVFVFWPQRGHFLSVLSYSSC